MESVLYMTVTMNKLVEMIYGSHLYGTNTPESDTDYKAVYIPNLKEVILWSYAKSINNMTNKTGNKNSNEDIDRENYSLQRFITMGFMWETVFIDMIHNRHTLLQTSPEREFLYENRSKFYTKKMKAYMWYCVSQAAKYGTKWSRLESAEKVLSLFEKFEGKHMKVLDLEPHIVEDDYTKWTTVLNHINWDNRFLDVCGKQFQGTASVDHYISTLRKFVANYGARAKKARDNNGTDWKAMSHALRATYQLIEIYQTWDLVFPLKDAEYLTKVKLGMISEEEVASEIERSIQLCQELCEKSTYPETVDQDFWNEWIYSLYVSEWGQTR